MARADVKLDEASVALLKQVQATKGIASVLRHATAGPLFPVFMAVSGAMSDIIPGMRKRLSALSEGSPARGPRQQEP